MSGVKVAEVYADMSLNINQQSLSKINTSMAKVGKQSAESLQTPFLKAADNINQGFSFLSKTLKGFLAVSAVSAGFNMVTDAVQNMNKELGESINFVDGMNDIASALDISFQQAQQLNIAATLGGMDGAQTIYKHFKQFNDVLGQLKKGERNEATEVLNSVIGQYVGKENNLALFGRMINSNKNVDHETAMHNSELVFGNVRNNAEAQSFLLGDGYDKLQKAYSKNNLYVSDKKAQQFSNAEETLAETKYGYQVKNINFKDVPTQVKTAKDSMELAQTTKEIKDSTDDLLSKGVNVTNNYLKALTDPQFWIKVAKGQNPGSSYTNNKGGK